MKKHVDNYKKYADYHNAVGVVVLEKAKFCPICGAELVVERRGASFPWGTDTDVKMCPNGDGDMLYDDEYGPRLYLEANPSVYEEVPKPA